MNLTDIGLIVIAIAWLVQLVYSYKGNKKISNYFIIGYIIGVALLVISIFQSTGVISYYELGTLVAAALVLIFNNKKK